MDRIQVNPCTSKLAFSNHSNIGLGERPDGVIGIGIAATAVAIVAGGIAAIAAAGARR